MTQIRIHLAYVGHPLLGDPLYEAGGTPKPGLLLPRADEAAGDAARGDAGVGRVALPRDGGYLLHALRATLPHPESGELISVGAPPPAALCVEGETPLEAGAVEGTLEDALRPTPSQCEPG